MSHRPTPIPLRALTAALGSVPTVALAKDAKVTQAVIMRHYVDEEDEELRAASNRTYRRLVASISPKVAERYGYMAQEEGDSLKEQLAAAVAAKDRERAQKLLDELFRVDQPRQ